MMAGTRVRAQRRVEHRIETAERSVRQAMALLPDAVPPADLERDTRTLGELADLLAETARAFGPARRAAAAALHAATIRAQSVRTPAPTREDGAGAAFSAGGME